MEFAQELLNLFNTKSDKLDAYVSKLKTDHYDQMPEIFKKFISLMSDKEASEINTIVAQLRKKLLMQRTEEDYIRTIESDVNKNFAHLTEEKRLQMFNEQVEKFKDERTKKKKKQQMKKANKDKNPEELIEKFKANIEKQLAHKTPEERTKKVEEEVKKYKEIIERRGKSIDQLVEEEKAEISKKINEFLEEKYKDKTAEEKKVLHDEYFEKNVKLYREGLEDTKIFNKKMEEKRKELEEIKYADNAEGLNEIRKHLVEIHINQKRKFLGILDENDIKKASDANTRVFEKGKEPIVKYVPPAEETVELEELSIKPIVEIDMAKHDRIVNKYKTTNKLIEQAISDENYFEHQRTEYVYHDQLNKDNFLDENYFYKCYKYYNDKPERKQPYINLLYSAKEIDSLPDLTEEEIQATKEAWDKYLNHQLKLREKKAIDEAIERDRKNKLEEIDSQVLSIKEQCEAGTLTNEKYLQNLEELLKKRNEIEPPEKTPEELLQDYALEMREKYSKIENVRLERSGIINEELKEYSKLIKREITRDRKLKADLAEKRRELEDRKLPKSKINHELEQYKTAREKELNTYFIPHGVDPKEHDDIAIRNSKILFADYLKQKDTEVWKSMEPEMKQEYFKTKYPQFYDSFPIVVKFMIQQGKFEVTAFKRFLEKCRINIAAGANPYAQNMPKKGSRRLTDGEEKWLENQAYYVQYLIEDYRKRVGQRLTVAEANWLRNKQLEALRNEMMDFRSNFERIAEDLKSKHNDNDEILLKEYIEEIKKGTVELTPDEQENIAFAIEQIAKRKEAIAAKIKEAEKLSSKELINVEDKAPEDVVKQDNEKKPVTKHVDEKKRLMYLKKKFNKNPSSLTEAEALDLALLKNKLKTQEEVKERNEKLETTVGCYCLKYNCPKCTTKLTPEESTKFEEAKKEIANRDPKSWNMYESFIMKKPSGDTVLIEYAGGYLEPVSVRQFLRSGEFSINGDKLEIINRHKKYGNFY